MTARQNSNSEQWSSTVSHGFAKTSPSVCRFNLQSIFIDVNSTFSQGRSRLKDQSVLYGPARIRHIFTVEFKKRSVICMLCSPFLSVFCFLVLIVALILMVYERCSVNELDSRQALTDEDIHTVPIAYANQSSFHNNWLESKANNTCCSNGPGI
mmetsp:Transcript_16662/g.45357  ORF Transcript_16662/g.45357 Transcript_16662/m.45357 type:complete len:154 (+) Transcript_16662:995-1456(+)